MCNDSNSNNWIDWTDCITSVCIQPTSDIFLFDKYKQVLIKYQILWIHQIQFHTYQIFDLKSNIQNKTVIVWYVVDHRTNGCQN